MPAGDPGRVARSSVSDSVPLQSAVELVGALEAGEISAVELMSATYDRLEAVNPSINAIVNALDRDRAIALAEQSDRERRRNGRAGPLAGLPIAAKDLVDAEGFPTTLGFLPFKDQTAKADSPLIARQKAAGAIVIGKTNTPEFGLGSHTFNRVFGATRNPYNLAKSAGGSSGGAAAALAAGIVSVSDGSDMGGSLRNPASFCNVVGFRPSIGRISRSHALGWLGRMSTEGPMARSVEDVARLFSVQVAHEPDDPLSLGEPGSVFAADLSIDPAGLRIACTEDLGFLPVEAAVRRVIAGVPATFQDMGCSVNRDYPNLRNAMHVFQVQRAANLAMVVHELDRSVPRWRDFTKDTALWNFDKGLALSASEILESEAQRTLIYQEAVSFFERYDALALPTAQVLPFDVETDWVREIEGVAMTTYIDWMSVCCVISVTGFPAISLPAGFSEDGLPVGVQLVGPPGGDLKLLKIARAFEQATGFAARRPPLAGS